MSNQETGRSERAGPDPRHQVPEWKRWQFWSRLLSAVTALAAITVGIFAGWQMLTAARQLEIVAQDSRLNSLSTIVQLLWPKTKVSNFRSYVDGAVPIMEFNMKNENYFTLHVRRIGNKIKYCLDKTPLTPTKMLGVDQKLQSIYDFPLVSIPPMSEMPIKVQWNSFDNYKNIIIGQEYLLSVEFFVYLEPALDKEIEKIVSTYLPRKHYTMGNSSIEPPAPHGITSANMVAIFDENGNPKLVSQSPCYYY